MRRKVHIVLCGAALASLLQLLTQCGDQSFGTATGDDAATGGDGSQTEAGRDSAPPDASRVDGSSILSPCVGAEHWLCGEFDREGAVADPPYWSSELVEAGAVLTIAPNDGSANPSPPNVLVTSADKDQSALVFASSTTAASGLRCDFSFRLNQRTDTFTDTLAELSLYGAIPVSPFYRVSFGGGTTDTLDGVSDQGKLPDGGEPMPSGFAAHSLKTGAWSHASIEATFGPTGHVTIMFDGVAFPFTPQYDLRSIPSPSYVTLQLGTTTSDGPSGRWAVDYDNVVCDLL